LSFSSSIELGRYAIFGRHLTPFLSNFSKGSHGFVLINLALKSAIKKGYIDITTAF